MLSKVLNKATCAECKICCGFDRTDSWETPDISEKLADMLKAQGIKVIKNKGNYNYVLDFEGDEIKYCPFLDKNKGCILSEDDKPFDCKIWPLRPMKKDDSIVLAVAGICPEFKNDTKSLEKLIDDDLYEKITEYIKLHPQAVKEFNHDYKVIKKL